MKGKFVVFEGCEGVGKSTQIKFLKEYLQETGQEAVFTREPGGTAVAEEMRTVLLNGDLEISPIVEAYLFATARADHVSRVIKPALESGKLVVCDRFLASSIAYQGHARGLGEDKVYEINKNALGGCLPDLTVFIDMDPTKSWRKLSGKEIENDRMEHESMAFHLKVYEGFKQIEKSDSAFAAVVPCVDKQETHRKILNLLRKRGIIR